MAQFHGEMPDALEQVPHELYPKNGDQMWESYKKYSSQLGEKYDDGLILESIERILTKLHMSALKHFILIILCAYRPL